MSDIVERLRHCSENCGDEYLHELTGKAADTITRLTAEIDLLAILATDREEYLQLLTDENNKLRAALKLDKPRAAWADAIQKNGRLCEEIERLRAVVDVADKLQNGIRAATSLTAENKKLRAALLVARKYVLVQSCELSLMPEDAARDLDVIDEALEEDDD
jgi:hypothetical protein